jgi:hypothetical protein
LNKSKNKKVFTSTILAILLVSFVMLMLLFIPRVKASTEYENSTGSAEGYGMVFDSHWHAQTFTVGATGHTVTSVYLYLAKSGSPTRSLTVTINTASGNLPTSTILTSGTINEATIGSPGYYPISLTEYSLQPNTQYSIVVSDTVNDATNYVEVYFSFLNPYSGGQYCYSDNSGSSWAAPGSPTYDMLFQVWGNPVYTLTVTSTYDTPSPSVGSHSYISGASVTASVTSPVSGGTGIQYVCTGWTGTGSVPSSGSGTSTSFTITQASSITWNWQTQYYLTFSFIPPPTPSGAGWYYSGSTAYVSLSSGTVSGGSGVQYVFTSWGGDASGSNYYQSNGITMNAPKTVTTNDWTTQYYFTVSSSHDSATGQGWYNSGATANSTVTTPSNGYLTTGWTGTGSLSSGGTFGSATTGNFSITTPSNCTWNWELAQLAITFSNTTSSRISQGSTFYVNGTILYNGTTIPPASGLATIYVSSAGTVKGQTTTYNSTTGNFNFSATAQSSVANWTYTVYATDSLGTSIVNQTLYIASDSLTITLNTDTTAPTGGNTVHMNATATYAFDGTNVTTLGVTIQRNNTKYSTSLTWTDAEASGTTYNFTVQATNDTLYHLTAFTGNTLTISWGSTVVIEVSSIYQNSTHTGISQSVTLAYRVIFGGNGSDVTSGNLVINSTVHSITNGWCNFTVTDPNIELVTYAASGSSFSNTVFSQVPANPQVIWDEVNVALYFTSTSPQVSQDIVITWAVTRLYDSSPVTNFNMTIYVNYAPVYMNISQAISSITDSLQSSGSKTYSIGYFIDSDINMTSYTNTAQTVTWSSQGSGFNPITTTPAIAYSVTVVVTKNSAPVVGVQIVINGQVATTDVSGLANFTLAQGTYPVTISSNGQLLYSGSVAISASTQTIPIDLTPQPAVPEGTNFVTLGIIVITVIIVLVLIGSGIRRKPSEKESWRKLLS